MKNKDRETEKQTEKQEQDRCLIKKTTTTVEEFLPVHDADLDGEDSGDEEDDDDEDEAPHRGRR